jgi:ferredoxin-NADP reductase
MTSEASAPTGHRLRAPAPAPRAAAGRWRLAPEEVLAAIALGATAVAIWPLVVALRAPMPLQPAPLVAHVCGMLAGYGVVVLLALMSRAPALERGIGADVLTRWHGRGGRIVVGLILVHAWAAVVAWAQSRQESTLLALWHVLAMPGLVAATLGTLLLLAVAAASARAARRRLSYEAWHGLHLEELRAEAGQFFRWRFLTPDNWLTAHPFSLSAPPTGNRLRLTVKALGQGSTSLQSVAVGTWVVAEGPYGAMTAARRTRRDVLLIAGGVGITPMRALFETLPRAPGQDLTLLYRARSLDDVLFRDELEEIVRRRGGQVQYLLGRDPDCLSASGLLRQVRNLADRDVYLCGPPRMADAVRTAALRAGLPAERLHEERFAF